MEQYNPEDLFRKEIIHGNAPEELKEQKREELKESRKTGYSPELSDEELAELMKAELPKTPVDLEAINLANKFTNKLRIKYGLEPIDIDEKHVHILAEEDYKRLAPAFADNPACYMANHQAIFVKNNEKVSPIDRVGIILHETIHSKQFQSDQIFEFRKGKFRDIYRGPFRGGIKAFSNLKHDKEANEDFSENFIGLNEAVVVEIEKSILPLIIENSSDIPKDPFINLEKKTHIAERLRVPVSEIEFTDEYSTSILGYRGPRQTLDFVIESIVDDEKSLTKGQVMDMFFRAHFSGNLLEIGRLVEKTFGKGSFRLLAGMTGSDESAQETKESLAQKRI